MQSGVVDPYKTKKPTTNSELFLGDLFFATTLV